MGCRLGSGMSRRLRNELCLQIAQVLFAGNERCQNIYMGRRGGKIVRILVGHPLFIILVKSLVLFKKFQTLLLFIDPVAHPSFNLFGSKNF